MAYILMHLLLTQVTEGQGIVQGLAGGLQAEGYLGVTYGKSAVNNPVFYTLPVTNTQQNPFSIRQIHYGKCIYTRYASILDTITTIKRISRTVSLKGQCKFRLSLRSRS